MAWPLAAGVGALVLIAGAGLHAWSAHARANVRDRWRLQLTAMAEDRVAAIERRISERLADARTFSSYPSVGYLCSGRQGPPFPFPREEGARGHVVELFRQLQTHYGYEGVWLVGGEPTTRVLAGTSALSPPEGAAERARERAQASFAFQQTGAGLRLVVGAPVWSGRPGAGRPIGSIVFTADAHGEVFGLLRREPVPTRTGETLLVRREGSRVVLLSPARHSGGQPGSLERPLSADGVEARTVVEGRRDFGTFVDYRGATVLAAVVPLPGAPDLSLIAKIDQDEAFAEFRAERRWIVAFASALMIALAGVGFGLWRQQTASSRLALARSEARFVHFVEYAADAILVIRPDGRIARANRRAEELYGYDHDQLVTMRIHDLYPPDQVDLITHRMRAASQLAVTFEADHRARDGTPLEVEVASRFLELDGEEMFVSIVREIGNRKAAERRVAFLNRLLRTMAEVNELMVREVDRARLLHEACRILVEQGGYRMAWIGLRDPQTEWIVPTAWAGHEDGYLSSIRVTADERSAEGRGPVGRAARENRTVDVADIELDEDFAPWRDAARARGYRSLAATPVRSRGQVAGVLALYSAEPGRPIPEVTSIIEELADDVGFALEAIDARRERDQAANDLRESESRFKRLAQNAPDVIFRQRIRPTPGTEYLSPAVRDHVGYEPEDFYADPRLIERVVHPDDRRLLDAATRGELPAGDTLLVRWLRRGGGVTWAEIRLVLVRNEAGELVAIEGISRDVTQRLAAERVLRQLSAVVEQSPEAIVITDTKGVIEYVNPAFTRHTGFTREEAVGQNPRILKSGHHPPEFYAAIYEALARGEEFRADVLNRRKDGGLYWEHAAFSPILDRDGRAAHYLAVKEDITERKRAEEMLRHTQEQLALSQKLEAVGRLAGGVAHDFNNLLGVIIGRGEIVESSLPPDGEQRRHLSQIMEAAQRAAELTRQLLAFSRRQVLELRVIDPNTVVTGIEKMLRRLIGEDVRLVTELFAELGHARVDPGQLSQVLMNLAVNARDAMPQGGTLRITTANVEVDAAFAAAHQPQQPGPYVQITVSDDGQGMEESVRAHAFEPFFTTKAAGQGTGLGLATVYGIVKQSGSFVWLDSAPGRGATFTIHLPRVSDPVEAAPRRPAAQPGGSETLLVVEDQEGLRDLLDEMLRQGGYTVLAAADGPSALALSAQYPGTIHLLVTDVIMPGMNGRELLDKIREHRPRTRALFVSGYTNDVIARTGAGLDGALLLEKPFGGEGLFRAVREALAQDQE